MNCWHDGNLTCMKECELIVDCPDRERMLEIRAEALKPIAKILDDFVCGRIENSIVALNRINKCVCEQTKEQKYLVEIRKEKETDLI